MSEQESDWSEEESDTQNIDNIQEHEPKINQPSVNDDNDDDGDDDNNVNNDIDNNDDDVNLNGDNNINDDIDNNNDDDNKNNETNTKPLIETKKRIKKKKKKKITIKNYSAFNNSIVSQKLASHLKDIENLIGKIDIENILHMFIDDILGRFVEYPFDVNLKFGKNLKNAYIEFIRVCVGKDISDIDIIKEIRLSFTKDANDENNGDDDSEIIDKISKVLIKVLNVRRGEISKKLQDEIVAIFPQNLQDYDWSLRLIIANDKITNYKESVVLLTFHIKNCNNSESDIHVELTQKQLKSVIVQFQAIDNVLDELSVV